MSGLLNFYVFLLVAVLCLTAPLTVALLLTGPRARLRSALLVAGAGLPLAGIFVVRTDWVAGALVVNAVLIPVLLALRRWPAPLRHGLLLAAGFYAAGAYVIWRMEWFDVWRHGVPGVGYRLQTMVPIPSAMAVSGWFLGRRLARWNAGGTYDRPTSAALRRRLTHPRA